MKLPEEIEEKRSRVRVEQRNLKNTTTNAYHSMYDSVGFDNSFSLENFEKNFKVSVVSLTEDEIVFDMIGVDAAIANTLRRIMIAEVPSVCIENVFIQDNTSVIQDEILAHRLGLIPLKIDPRLYEYKMGADYSESNTVVFTLNVACTKKSPEELADGSTTTEKYNNTKVYSRQLEWQPTGDQEDLHKDDRPRPVHDDILIAKLGPEQRIGLTCYCVKGIGKDHAKFSPVATASYRLLPDIQFTSPVEDAQARKLVDLCPMKVFDIEDLAKGGKGKTTPTAVVRNPRACTMCRECIRHEEFANTIKLMRVKDHFIFSVESCGMYRPEEIVVESLKVLMQKLATLKQEVGLQ